MKYLIFGNGFIGNKFLKALGSEAVLSPVDIADSGAIREVLYNVKPEVVINCAGKTGKPNIDWCESNKEETYRSNVTGAFILANACFDMDVRMVHIGSGCVYQADGFGYRFTEEDIPDFDDLPSFYSMTKAVSESLLKHYPVLQIRIRMPIDDDLTNPRNFITKILKYDKVINELNSMTIIDDMIDVVKFLVDKEATGVYNVTNNGAITHKEVLDLYKEIIDPTFEYTIIPTEELDTKAGRSNCILNTDKLDREGIEMPDIKSTIIAIMMRNK